MKEFYPLKQNSCDDFYGYVNNHGPVIITDISVDYDCHPEYFASLNYNPYLTEGTQKFNISLTCGSPVVAKKLLNLIKNTDFSSEECFNADYNVDFNKEIEDNVYKKYTKEAIEEMSKEIADEVNKQILETLVINKYKLKHKVLKTN